MIYTFKILIPEIKRKIYKLKNNSSQRYYKIPLVQKKNGVEKLIYIAIPTTKTEISNDTLYIYLDNSTTEASILTFDNDCAKLTDDSVLKIINNDYLSYIKNTMSDYSLPHSIDIFMPSGIRAYNIEQEREYMDLWSKLITKLQKIYHEPFIAINPPNDKIYPFIYRDFTNKNYIKEIKSNIIMFTLTYDRHFEFINKEQEGKTFIYYNKRGNIVPVYQMLTEQQYYEICEEKDRKNNALIPFLKQFNDYGNKKLSTLIDDDETYLNDLIKTYNSLREEMNLDDYDTYRYLIPSNPIEPIMHILNKKHNNEQLTRNDKEKLAQWTLELISLYNDNKIFYFSYDDLEIIDDNINFNSALKRITEYHRNNFYYDQKSHIVYIVDDLDQIIQPVLEAVTKEQLELIKDMVYESWLYLKKEPNKR